MARPSRTQAKCHSPFSSRETFPASSNHRTTRSQLPTIGAKSCASSGIAGRSDKSASAKREELFIVVTCYREPTAGEDSQMEDRDPQRSFSGGGDLAIGGQRLDASRRPGHSSPSARSSVCRLTPPLSPNSPLSRRRLSPLFS